MSLDFKINAPSHEAVTPQEVINVRGELYSPDRHRLWYHCLRQSLYVVGARQEEPRTLLGVGFLVGNLRHAEIVDLSVVPDARNQGIGGAIVDELVRYAQRHQIPYLGLTFDQKSPFLEGFYTRHGFAGIDFSMWHVDSLKAMRG